jgi:hypothetical protein
MILMPDLKRNNNSIVGCSYFSNWCYIIMVVDLELPRHESTPCIKIWRIRGGRTTELPNSKLEFDSRTSIILEAPGHGPG